MGAAALGRIYRNTMRNQLAPTARADSIYGATLTLKVLPRAIRALTGSRASAMAKDTFTRLAPKPAATTSANRMPGKDIKTSTRRWIIMSTTPPIYPASIPIRAPTRVPIDTERTPAISDVRAPYITRESISLPKLSVPKGKEGEGGWKYAEVG